MKLTLLSLLVTVWLALPPAGIRESIVKNDNFKTIICKETGNKRTNTCEQKNIRQHENSNGKKNAVKKGKPLSAFLFDSMMSPVMAL